MASSFSTPVELGLTIPLQRHLGIKALSYSEEPSRRFCWDLHVIPLRGRLSLLAIHCHSRYTFVLYKELDQITIRYRNKTVISRRNTAKP